MTQSLRRPSSSNKKSDFHMTYQSDDDEGDDECDDVIKSGWQLYEQIFTHLDPPTLMTSRQVCRQWNEVISKCTDSLLWSKVCVKIEGNQNWPDANYPGITTTTLTIASLNIFHSPNFHFVRCDFRLEKVHDFFVSRGPFLKFLKISDCILSLPMLQLVICTCDRLEHFQIHGLSQNVVIAETIFPQKVKLRKFPCLKTLILKSTTTAAAAMTKKSAPRKRRHGQVTNDDDDADDEDEEEEDEAQHYKENNLSCGFIQDLIEYSDNLRRIELIGWSPKTASDFVSILCHRGRYKNLVEFHMTQVPPVLKSVHLIPLCVKTSHIRLKKLTISPATRHQSHDFGNIVIREVIKNYRETLEELNITNCPVGSTIFRFPLPALRILVVVGTLIKSPVLFRHQTPKLEKFICQEQNPDLPLPLSSAWTKQFFDRIQFLLGSSSSSSSSSSYNQLLNPHHILERGREALGHFWMSQEDVHRQTFADMMTMSRDPKRKQKSSRKMSMISSLLDPWIDFGSLVILTAVLITIIIYGFSSIFQHYSPIVFLVSIFAVILFEFYENFIEHLISSIFPF